MRRAELERKLRHLGYAPVGQRSGKGHVAWYGPFGRVSIPVLTEDEEELILDRTANEILALAREEVESE